MSYLLFSFVTPVVPAANVSVTALDENPTIVGKPFSMECNVTVARGVVSSVDIIWIVNGTVKRNRTVNNSLSRNNSLQYVESDVYTITELQLSDNNTVYHCKAVIDTYEQVEDSDSVTVRSITLGMQVLYNNVTV